MKKTMRFLSMTALALVGAVMTGCTNDDNILDEPQQPENKNNVVTMTTTISLDDGTTTRALTSGGVKTFAAGEQIAVVYENMSCETVKVVSEELTDGDITGGGKTATFTVTLTNPKASGDVKYIYPASMAKADGSINYDALATQDGTLATLSSTLDLALYEGSLTAEANLPTSTTMLTNQLAILAITLKDNATPTANDITGTITRLNISDGTYNYFITRSATAGPIYVTIRPTASANMMITAFDGTIYHTKSLASKTYEASNGYPLSWRMTAIPASALPGEFTINNSGDKVHFSQGNLKYNGGVWSFHVNQYDVLGSWSSTSCDLFYWETNGNYGAEENYTDASQSTSDVVDWGTCMGSGWSTPSKDVWRYIFNSRTASTVNGTANARYATAQVNSMHGIILFPDYYTHPTDVAAPTGINDATGYYGWVGNNYSTVDWTKMEVAGAVFLPAAGARGGTEFEYVDEAGFYWSSTGNEYIEDGNYYADFAEFFNGRVDPYDFTTRSDGLSVRLVKNVE
ncbi:MAG: hypothetical protein IJT97_00910 [Bacteroidaceae bacterium]|nr:hypothetical protein [Bacteroidaceae bacterium]